jgi:hypothetical protein
MMPAPGAVDFWALAYGTPDVAASQGCGNSTGFVGMWGNMNSATGEGLSQNLGSALITGKTYLVSLCGRRATTSNQPLARFRVRATSGPVSSWGIAGTVGLSQAIPTTWTPINFIWTAPAIGPPQFLTINVENNLTIDNGSQISYGHVDNVCIRELDFTACTVCQGQPTVFTTNATGAAGVNSWNWNFGDGTPPSSLQNPSHVYTNAGTYNVTLCVNGSTSNCVTKPVTVNPKPPAPVIMGPSNLCGGLQASYSVAPASGVTYAWTVSGGTINGSSTGTSVSVTWSPSGGTIFVTATNKQGCSTRASLKVFACNVQLGDCCHGLTLNATAPTPVHVGSNVYTLTPTLTLAGGPIIRVVANVISTERTFSSATCGTNGPVSSHVVSATPSPGFPLAFNPSLPVAFSHEVIWNGPTAQSLPPAGLAFPFQIQFPPPPGPGCSDTLKFCVKYTFTLSNCRSCEIIRCYSIVRKKIFWSWDPALSEGFVTVGRPFTVAVAFESPESMPLPGPLVLSLKPGTGARGARLEGRTTAEVADGRASFGDLVIDRTGQGYVLVVSGPGLPEPMESDPFDVAQETPRQ